MPYNKSFIDQASSVKIAGHWPRSLFAFLWTSTSSRSIKAEGESSAGVQPSWPRAWSIIYTSWTAWSLKQLAVQHKSWSSSENSLQSTWPCYAGMLARELPSLISFPVLALCHSRLKTLEIKNKTEGNLTTSCGTKRRQRLWTYFQYLHLDIQRQQYFTYKPDRNAPITTHHPHDQWHRSSNYQSQYWSENHYIYLNFQPSLDSVNYQLPPTSWVFNAIFVSSDSLLSGISFFHKEVRVNCSVRSRWVEACNSHTKPISKHFYRLIYF